MHPAQDAGGIQMRDDHRDLVDDRPSPGAERLETSLQIAMHDGVELGIVELDSDADRPAEIELRRPWCEAVQVGCEPEQPGAVCRPSSRQERVQSGLHRQRRQQEATEKETRKPCGPTHLRRLLVPDSVSTDEIEVLEEPVWREAPDTATRQVFQQRRNPSEINAQVEPAIRRAAVENLAQQLPEDGNRRSRRRMTVR